MSRIISFSGDNEFLDSLDSMIEETGYKNRSMFLRDASFHFADSSRGDLSILDDDSETEGVLVIFYQHGVESKILDIRHSNSVEVSSFHHNCLTGSHTCVDTLQIKGTASSLREIVSRLRNTNDVDRVSFVPAPLREAGCC
jgi:metal-responsive CopG/Arc/MetJ family transcriptional regulator